MRLKQLEKLKPLGIANSAEVGLLQKMQTDTIAPDVVANFFSFFFFLGKIYK